MPIIEVVAPFLESAPALPHPSPRVHSKTPGKFVQDLVCKNLLKYP